MHESEVFFDKPIEEMRWLNGRELLLTAACVAFTVVSCVQDHIHCAVPKILSAKKLLNLKWLSMLHPATWGDSTVRG